MRAARPACPACTIVRNAYEDLEHSYSRFFTLHPFALFGWYARLREHHFHLIHVEVERRSNARDTLPM
jgi:hypothetical protein